MVGFDVERGIEFQNALFCHYCLRHALVLLLEQKLSIQVRELNMKRSTSIVSISKMCTLPIGDFDSTFRISHPMPPTPTIKIWVLPRMSLLLWMSWLILKRWGVDESISILQILVIMKLNIMALNCIHIQLS